MLNKTDLVFIMEKYISDEPCQKKQLPKRDFQEYFSSRFYLFSLCFFFFCAILFSFCKSVTISKIFIEFALFSFFGTHSNSENDLGPLLYF